MSKHLLGYHFVQDFMWRFSLTENKSQTFKLQKPHHYVLFNALIFLIPTWILFYSFREKLI